MAKRKRRRRNRRPAREPQPRNWSLIGIGTAILLVAAAFIIGTSRAI